MWLLAHLPARAGRPTQPQRTVGGQQPDGTPYPESVVSTDGESFSELPSAHGWDVLWSQDSERGRDGVMDEALRAELLEMERVDRAVRADLVARGELHRPGYHPQMEAVHRRHNARMRAIINAHGWPGYSLVGADGCRAAGFLVQHAILDHALQRECLERLRQAVEAGAAAPVMLALLTGPALRGVGPPQGDGTQYVGGGGGGLRAA